MVGQLPGGARHLGWRPAALPCPARPSRCSRACRLLLLLLLLLLLRCHGGTEQLPADCQMHELGH